jgi:hypothetical protein
MLTKSFQEKKTIVYVAYVKRINIGAKISLFTKPILSLHSPQKCQFFDETVRAHILYEDIHANFFSYFLYFQIYILDKGSICTKDQKCISDYLSKSYVENQRGKFEEVGTHW